jgi:molecular chaperone HscB
MKFYEALGLEPKLSVDSDDLTKRFYERSRKWHPDRFGRASVEEQQRALEMTSTLNDAFRTLRDPIARAEYYLRESGVEPTKEVPPELLEEVFELNLALEELRGGDTSVRGQLESAGYRFRRMLTEIDGELKTVFEQPSDKHLRQLLDRRRYISNLVNDVEKELHVHVSD